MNDQEAFAIAIEEAKISYKEGGVPVNTPPLFKSLLYQNLTINTDWSCIGV